METIPKYFLKHPVEIWGVLLYYKNEKYFGRKLNMNTKKEKGSTGKPAPRPEIAERGEHNNRTTGSKPVGSPPPRK